MASGFKQQCPSCEAMVPIRDLNLVGRKIDCPTCKYRFVVEEPAEESSPEPEEAVAKSGKGRPAAAAGRRAGGADAPTKTKPTGRRRDEEDDEDRPRAKSDGGSTKLVVGLVAGFLGLVLIALAVYFAAFHEGGGSGGGTRPAPAPGTGSTASTTTPTTTGSQANTTPESGTVGLQVGTTTDNPAAATTQTTAAALSDIYSELTNLLPNDAQGVIHVPFKALHGSATIGKLAFEVPGAFSSKTFEERVGIRLDEIERTVHAVNYRKNWSYHVIKTVRPFDFEVVKKRMQLTAAPGGKGDYLLGQSNDWLDSMFRNKETVGAAKLGPLAVAKHNETTLIFGDEEPVRSYIGANGKFTTVHKGPYIGIAATPAAGGTANNPAVTGIGAGAGLDSGGPVGRGGGAVGLTGSPVGAGDGTPPAEGTPVRPHFATIPLNLKAMLDRLEERPTLVTMAFDTRAAGGRLQRHIPTYINLLVLSGFSVKQLEQAAILGLAVQQTRGGFNLTAQVECNNVNDSRAIRKGLQDAGPKLIKLLDTAFGIKATVVNDQAEPPDPTGPTAGGTDTVGGVPPRIGLGGESSGPGGVPPRQGLSGDLIRGSAGSGLVGMAGAPAAGGVRTGQPEEAAPASTTIEPLRVERTVQLRVNLVLDEPGQRKLDALIQQHVRQLRGDQEMATGLPKWHEVGAATLAERDKNGGAYPRGAYPREAGGSRAGIPYSPNQRVSWMASLLPHLGYDVQPNFEKSWRDPENLPAASVLVTQFLDPRYPRASWWVRYPGMTQDVAATHIVGMAGVGNDAAEYRADDPNTKAKLGIFGYDRVTKLNEIPDGAENTIMMIQVPPTFKRPWMAGGGATVMGIPDPPPPSQRSVTPFVSTQYNGKRGTMAVMADGSVRFIAEDISDDLFKGMATTQGGEVPPLERDVPRVKQDDVVAVRTEPTPKPVIAKPTTASLPPISQWKEHTSSEGGFSILLPRDPFKGKQSVKSPAGDIEVNTFVVQLGLTDSVGVVFVKQPSVVAQLGPDALYEGAKAGMAAQMPGGKLVKEEKITIAGQPAREFHLDVAGKTQLRLRVVLIQDRLYQILISGPTELVSSADATQFLGSFKLTGK